MNGDGILGRFLDFDDAIHENQSCSFKKLPLFPELTYVLPEFLYGAPIADSIHEARKIAVEFLSLGGLFVEGKMA
jgi:hypothetical protein